MIKNSARYSVFISWLFSYFFVLLIPLFISVVVYIESVRTLEDEVGRVHLGSLMQLKQSIDGKLKEVENISLEIALDREIQGLALERSSFTPFQTLSMLNIINKLSTYKITNNIVDIICIYFKHNNTILTSNKSSYDLEDWYKVYFKDIGLEYKQYEQLFTDNHSGKFEMLFHKDGTAKVKDIAYLKSLPLNSINENDSGLLITISQNEIKHMLQNFEWSSQGIFTILDSHNNIVVSTKDFQLPEVLFYNNLNIPGNRIYTNLFDEEVVVTYINSDATDWKYISIIPTDIFLTKLRYIRTVTITFVVVCLLLGGLVSFIFSKKNYNPIKRMVNLFKGAANAPESKLNEYGFIESSINDVIEERKSYIKNFEKQNEYLKNNFINRLIKGRIDKKININDALKKLNIVFPGEYFAVMLYYIEKVSEVFQQSSSEAREDCSELVCFIIKNVVEELAAKNNSGYVIESDNSITCLICFRSENLDDARTEMYRIANESKELFASKFGIYTSVSFSNVHLTAAEICTAYQEAADAMEYMKMMAHNFIIEYNSVKDNSLEVSHRSYLNESEKKLENVIISRDFSGAELVLKQIFEEDIFKGNYSAQILKYRMFGLINIMFIAVRHLSFTFGMDFLNTLNPIDRLLDCKNLSDLQYQMLQILKSFDQYIKDSGHSMHLRERVINYINMNYDNKDLNVSKIADVFNLNASYLSRTFKEQMDIGLLEYIHITRIKAAKKLLANTGISIKDIAEKTGFDSSIAFIRVFKKFEGVPPGKYTKQLNG